jgi:subtilisin family serine protease
VVYEKLSPNLFMLAQRSVHWSLAVLSLLVASAVASQWVSIVPGHVDVQALTAANVDVVRLDYSVDYDQTLLVLDTARVMGTESSGTARRLVRGATQHGAAFNISHNRVIVSSEHGVRAAPLPHRTSARQSGEDCRTTTLWHLDRVNQRKMPLDRCAGVDDGADGTGVNVYVVDTGIDGNHPSFGGRVNNAYTTLGTFDDCDGHGTHVAGLIGSTDYGAAPGVWLHSVRILDCTGSGTLGDLAAALMWIRDNGQQPGVVSMSLGYNFYDGLIGTLVQQLSSLGFGLVAAAGNDNQDACGHYPSGYTSVLSVGSSASNDVRSSFSNRGTCVSLFAPGSSLLSTWPGSMAMVLSGTSMAAPMVSAAVALDMQRGVGGAETIRQRLLATATSAQLKSLVNSPNLLLYLNDNTDQLSGTTNSDSGGGAGGSSGSSTTGSRSGAASLSLAWPAVIVLLLLLLGIAASAV